jgi:hypothetical protein
MKEKITSEIWQEIQGNILYELEKQSLSNPHLNKKLKPFNFLYHYTSLKGFISIVESQSLFCTNINFLNDSKEFKYGVEIIRESIRVIRNNKNANLLDDLDSSINDLYNFEKYVTCFSKEGDSLSQWRAYGDNGNGIAIGFNARTLKESFNNTLTQTSIEYDKESQINVIKEILKISIEQLFQFEEKYDWGKSTFNKLSTDFIKWLLNTFINGYKHPAFLDEREYRLQLEVDGNYTTSDEVKLLFKASDSLIIPYTIIENKHHSELRKGKEQTPSIGMENLPIENIIVGPKLDFESVKLGLNIFLKENGYTDIDILKSKAPYR